MSAAARSAPSVVNRVKGRAHLFCIAESKNQCALVRIVQALPLDGCRGTISSQLVCASGQQGALELWRCDT